MMNMNKNRLAFDEVNDCVVSTIKLPFFNTFETMVFGFYPNTRDVNYYERYVERYTNKEDAIDGHKRIVEMVKNNEFSKSGE